MSCTVPSTDRFPSTSVHPIGVIIPTYNRADVLASCLSHLELQTFKDFEVVVVDDGSTDSTPQVLADFQRRTALHLRYTSQINSGPARARNNAISMMRAPLALIIGDDILPTPNFVARHLEFHQCRPEIVDAALGLTRWSESGQTVTPFMRWLDESGIQFAYQDLFRGTAPSWRHFYTSNLSVKTQLLRDNPFDESFMKAAGEDLELGYRLELKHGLKIGFIPEALAYHLHPTSFRQACKRMKNVGWSIRRLHDLWPEIAEEQRPSAFRAMRRDFILSNQWLLPPITAFAEWITQFWCPNFVMHEALSFHFDIGYQRPSPSDKGRAAEPAKSFAGSPPRGV